MRVRSARAEDLDALAAIAESIDGNMTTMPRDRAGMKERLDRTLDSFDPGRRVRGDETYLFVLEDDGEIVGTSAIYSTVGYDRPFYSYKISKITKSAPDLAMRLETQILSPVNDYTGTAEVGMLYLRPDRRGQGRGSLLSLSRLLFLKVHRDRFTEQVLAEMRGYTDQAGRSPFWDAVGRKFFQLELGDADVRSAREYRFISDLLPRYPIYVDLLPSDAQHVIGRPHPGAEPAAALLRANGFRFHGYVDIFDAGPTLDAYIDDLPIVRESRIAPVVIEDQTADSTSRLLAGTLGLGDFAAVWATGGWRDDHLVIDPPAAAALEIREGDRAVAYSMPVRERS